MSWRNQRDHKSGIDEVQITNMCHLVIGRGEFLWCSNVGELSTGTQRQSVINDKLVVDGGLLLSGNGSTTRRMKGN